MKTKPIVLDQRIVDAINTLEIYKKLFEETGFLSKAKTLEGAIEDLKVCAYDSQELDGRELFTAFNKHIGEELSKPSVTEPDEDCFGPLIESDKSIDETVCESILKNIVDSTPLFVWYPICHGAHTVWTAKVYRSMCIEPSMEHEGVTLITLHDEDSMYGVQAADFVDGEISFNGNDYYPNLEFCPVFKQ